MSVFSADAAEDMTIIWNLPLRQKHFWGGTQSDGRKSTRCIGNSDSHYHNEGTSKDPSVYLEN